jgi:hypothetical protein
MRSICLASALALSAALPAMAVAGGPPPDLQLNALSVGVSIPLGLRHAGDGSGRVFMIQRAGQIRVYTLGSGNVGSDFLDISSLVNTTFEGGLLGLAFHPDYANNGYFYVNYTRSGTGGNALTTVIARYRVSAGNPNLADPASAREVLTIGQPAANHNGGDIHFGPDGHLYIGMGDGGASSATSQNLNSLLGKMLRIDPCTSSDCAVPYTIPAGNPFVGTATPDEIWSIGFRNPYRWSFDRDNGDMLIADVGASSREEVSLEPAAASGGLNYGWNCREGNIAGPGGCSGSFVEPILTYDHNGGRCSITGGYRYRGCIQGLRGTYVYADFCSRQVFFANETSPGNWSSTQWTIVPGNVYGFGEDEAGELYLLQPGSVSRFESNSTCLLPTLFEDGFES